MSWLAVAPSPFRGWVRWRPREWPAAPLPFFDVATRRIGWPDEGLPAAAALPTELPRKPGLVVLPPLDASRRAEREALRERLTAADFPVADTCVAGEPPADAPGRVVWIDPLAAWLEGESPETWSAAATATSAGAEVAIVVPLIAGLTPEGDPLGSWLTAFRTLAPSAVLGVVAELSPFERRRIVESRGDASFETVFHGRPPSEHAFARAAAAFGLRALPRRMQLPEASPRQARNLELAGALWEAAELALRLRDSEADCAALFAAARRAESTGHDLVALAREGNLGVLEWPSPQALALVGDLAGGGTSAWLDGLRRRWARGEGA